MAMTYRIVQMHGGAMEVRSCKEVGSPERGTTFTLRLPVAAFASDRVRKTAAVGQGEQAV